MLNWLPALLILIAHGGAGHIDSTNPHAMLRLITVASRLGEMPTAVVSVAPSVVGSGDQDRPLRAATASIEREIGFKSAGFLCAARVRDGPQS